MILVELAVDIGLGLAAALIGAWLLARLVVAIMGYGDSE